LTRVKFDVEDVFRMIIQHLFSNRSLVQYCSFHDEQKADLKKKLKQQSYMSSYGGSTI